jgi:hypothetical protein
MAKFAADSGGPADEPEEPVSIVIERLRRDYWLPTRERRQRTMGDNHDWFFMPIYEGEPGFEVQKRNERVQMRR